MNCKKRKLGSTNIFQFVKQDDQLFSFAEFPSTRSKYYSSTNKLVFIRSLYTIYIKHLYHRLQRQ